MLFFVENHRIEVTVDTANIMHSISCARMPYHDMLLKKIGTQLALIVEAFHWSVSLYKNDFSVLVGYEEGWITSGGRKQCQPSII